VSDTFRGVVGLPQRVGGDGLLHPGAVLDLWWFDHAQAWWNGTVLGWMHAGRAGAVPCPEQPDVSPTATGLRLRFAQQTLELPSRTPAPTLPDGARHPLRNGEWAAWSSEGFAYRTRGRIQVVGRIGVGRHLHLGPDGRVGLADDHGNLLATAARGRAWTTSPLPGPWRWSSSGVYSPEQRADGTRPTTGRLLVGDAEWDPDDGRVFNGQPVGWGLLDSSPPFLHGHVLVGPGGVAWDLQHGLPLHLHPVYVGEFALADAEHGYVIDGDEVEVVQRQTGEPLAHYRVRLRSDAFDTAGRVHGQPALRTVGGTVWLLGPKGAERADSGALEPVPSAATVGEFSFRWTRSGQLLAHRLG